MRVLVLSNLYPPCFTGGYEQLCCDVVNELQKRNYEVYVLTSNLKDPGINDEKNIYRELFLTEIGSLKTVFLSLINTVRNRAILLKKIKEVDPDIIYVWNMGGINAIILSDISSRVPVLFHFSDLWITPFYLSLKFRSYKIHSFSRPVFYPLLDLMYRINSFLIIRFLNFKYVSCSCYALKNMLIKERVPIKNARVIHEGISLDVFTVKTDKIDDNNKFSLLYAGSLVWHKGAHTCIEALAILVNERKINNLSLTLIGSGSQDYRDYLLSLVNNNGLQNYVNFLKPVAREKLPSLMHNYDIFVFPSIWAEPWSLILLMAMACGLPIISTLTGGSKEILIDSKNCITFTAEKSLELAEKIDRLYNDSLLREEIASGARKTITDDFSIERMVDNIELVFNDALLN